MPDMIAPTPLVFDIGRVLEPSAMLPHEPSNTAQADAVLLGDLLADAARAVVRDHGGDRLR